MKSKSLKFLMLMKINFSFYKDKRRKTINLPLLLSSFLIIYFLATFVIVHFNLNEESFFTGHWFVYTPIYFDDYGLYVTQVRDQKLPAPIYAEFIPELKNSPWFFQAYGLIQEIGRNLTNDNKSIAEVKMKILLEDVLKNTDLKFELHKRHFNSLDFINEHKVEKIDKLEI